MLIKDIDFGITVPYRNTKDMIEMEKKGRKKLKNLYCLADHRTVLLAICYRLFREGSKFGRT